MKDTKSRWISEGFALLAEEGAQGLRIDRVAARLGLSKGSFHHHFAGAPGYKSALLEHFERVSVESLESAIARTDGKNLRVRLAELSRLVSADDAGLYSPRLDVAVRAWASSDTEVAAMQARIDDARLAALQEAWRPFVATDGEAHAAALLPFLIGVGATVVVPPVDPDDLRAAYELLLPLVPEEPAERDR